MSGEPPRTHISETELLRRLDAWLASRGGTATFADVLATRDAHLFAAFVLRGFRAAAREAVFDRFALEARKRGFSEVDPSAGSFFFMIACVAEAWRLTGDETFRLLGLEAAADLDAIRDDPFQDVLPETLERGAILLDIFIALNAILPREAADRWIRKPNAARLFGGRPALITMIEGGLPALRNVRLHLRAEAAGN